DTDHGNPLTITILHNHDRCAVITDRRRLGRPPHLYDRNAAGNRMMERPSNISGGRGGGSRYSLSGGDDAAKRLARGRSIDPRPKQSSSQRKGHYGHQP